MRKVMLMKYIHKTTLNCDSIAAYSFKTPFNQNNFAGPKQGSPAEFWWLCCRCGTWSWQCRHLPSQRPGSACASRISDFFVQFILFTKFLPQVHLLIDQINAAIVDFNKAVDLQPNFPVAYVQKLYTDYRLKQWNRARWWFTIIKCRAANTIGDTVTVNKVLEQFNEAVEKFPK